MTCLGPYCTSDCIPRLFCSFYRNWKPNYRVNPIITKSRVDFHQFHMLFYQFQQAGNEEYQSLKIWNSAVGIVAAGSKGTVAKNSAKIRYVGHFSMIAKFLYDSEFSLS